jgi:hypothetical protein
MLNFSNLHFQKLAIHKVGNKHSGENIFISDELFEPDEDLKGALLHYFLKPFKKVEEQYRFRHISDLELHEMYSYSKQIFENPDNFLAFSIHILKYLLGQSDHPNIKSGELYITYFSDVIIEDEIVDAIGIFKSERKNTFLKVAEGGNSLQINKLDGISIEKLDKGCLILNTEKSDGYRVLTVDNNKYDAMYWIHHFLGIDQVENNSFHTKLYLEMCTEFAGDVIAPEDKREQIKFMSDSVEYFAANENFDFEEFKEQVLPQNEEIQKEFKTYQQDFALDEVNNFEISEVALRSAKRKIKSLIKLDTDIQIKLSMTNPESSQAYIERGFDEEKGMYFYKIFFNEEL